MPDAADRLAEFRAQPRSHLVLRQIREDLPRPPITELMVVTPETAEHWLRCKISPGEPAASTVRRYAALMKAGAWQPREREPIELQVSDSGRVLLVDGQHRLSAVVLAGKPIPLIVRFCWL